MDIGNVMVIVCIKLLSLFISLLNYDAIANEMLLSDDRFALWKKTDRL